MATYKIYKLHFTSPLHIGDKRDDEGMSMKTIQSDTLIAALTAVLAKVGHEVPGNGDLGFTVSSLFPYYQRGDKDATSYFLPMPLQSRLPNLTDVGNAKMVKKIRWVDAEFYPSILAGENLFDGKSEHFEHIHGEYLTTAVIPEGFIRSEVCQRVKLEDRTGKKDALPYYVDRITFAPGAGFYFLATGDTQLLDKGMHILSQEGIGTDRNAGYGFFEFTTDELTIDSPVDANHVVSMSLMIPADKQQLEELFASDEIAYELIRRGGWITSMPHNQLRKNAIYGFLPGSVFSKPQGEVCGTIVDLAPAIVKHSGDAHSVWRDGRSIMLPIKR
jgi:CRISPR type III-A-associated RAMP protein Csm4